MQRRICFKVVWAIFACASTLPCGRLPASEPAKPDGHPAAPTNTAPATPTAVNPMPLSESTKKALAYLISQQHASGGWGQGGGWRTASEGGRVEGAQVQDPPDVADTAIATPGANGACSRIRRVSNLRSFRIDRSIISNERHQILHGRVKRRAADWVVQIGIQ